MVEAMGFSHLYPAVPIMNIVSMSLLLLLIPGFWKTRMVALIALVVWMLLANVMLFISMIQWRGNANDVPILADIVAAFWRMWAVGGFASWACLAHFTWQRLQPLPVRQLYDTRRRNNLIHFVVSVIIPLLWAPLFIVSCPYRYIIVEDIGPVVSAREDWPGFVILRVPQILSSLAAILFNSLALVTYWRTKREDTGSDLLKHYSSVRTRKLLLLALFHVLLAAYGVVGQWRSWANNERVAPRSFAENIASLQTVLRETRPVLKDEGEERFISTVLKASTVPLLGFYLFAWFGCGAESRKAYREVLINPVRLVSMAYQPYEGSLPSLWSRITLRRPRQQRGLTNALPPTNPNPAQITPHISAVPVDNALQPSATPARNNPSIPGRNGIGIKRQGRVPSVEPARRLSMHKPPLATLNPADAVLSASDVPLRRLSYQKLPFVPLVPPSVPAITTPGASGSALPYVEGRNKTRRQENLTTRPWARRLSYHKPALVPLATANTGGGIQDVLGVAVPLMEVPRDIISERNAMVQAECTIDEGEAPPSPPPHPPIHLARPPFSSPSTSTAPPPFSIPFDSMSPPSMSPPSTSMAPPPPFSSLAPSVVSTSTAPSPLSTPSAITPAPPYPRWEFPP